jgi:hypothetical protein
MYYKVEYDCDNERFNITELTAPAGTITSFGWKRGTEDEFNTISFPEDDLLEDADLSLNEICDGIYCFEIVITLDAGGTATEVHSVFVDCDIRCQVAEKMYADKSSKLYQWYELVKLQVKCNYCDCDSAQQTYDYLLSVLGESNTTTRCKQC